MKELTRCRGPLDSKARDWQRPVAASGELHDDGHRLWDHAVNTTASEWTLAQRHRSSLTAVQRGAFEMTACRPHHEQLCNEAIVLVTCLFQMYDSRKALQ